MKVTEFCKVFNAESVRWKQSAKTQQISDFVDRKIKWTSELEAQLRRGTTLTFEATALRLAAYRRFYKCVTYFAPIITHRPYQQPTFFPFENSQTSNCLIAISGIGAARRFEVLATDTLPDLHFNGDSQCVALYRYDKAGNRIDNITDWALDQFRKHYPSSVTPAKAGVQRRSKQLDSGFRRNDDTKAISKEAIFHYVYAVLHDPLYREKYALNLKREFPRIPFCADFRQWAGWGAELMALHIGYEKVEPFALARTDVPDERARAAGQPPKPSLKADKDAGRIVIDSETTLAGIPPSAWDYRLGNRSALEWILDQYKEKKPKDATIREKFDTYRFADYKEKVIDLLLRVTRVSVETQRIVEAMRAAVR